MSKNYLKKSTTNFQIKAKVVQIFSVTTRETSVKWKYGRSEKKKKETIIARECHHLKMNMLLKLLWALVEKKYNLSTY